MALRVPEEEGVEVAQVDRHPQGEEAGEVQPQSPPQKKGQVALEEVQEEGEEEKAQAQAPEGAFQAQGVRACRAQVHPAPPGEPVPQRQRLYEVGGGKEKRGHRR